MGLLLSVLVVCVGVLEVIACVRHFQDGYLPLWTPHCAVTSGFTITHDRWRKLPSFDYAKNDDEKRFEDLTGAKNGAVTLGLQDDSVKSVENFEKTLRCAASLQDDKEVVSASHLQESETSFVAQSISDSLTSVNEPDKSINFTSDIHKQTVIDVFQSDVYNNNNLIQTEHNLEADITTSHTQDSTLTSDQDIQTQYEALVKEAELIQQPPEDIPDDSLKHAEEHEDDTHETTVVGAIHHEDITHITKDHTSESDSRLEPQTSSSDADVIRSKDIETRPQESPDSEVKNEETTEELIETLKKTPSPVRISPPISTPPLTPKKSKADISWPTFFPGAPVIKRPSVSFATPEALLAGEDPDPHPRNDEEERPATPPPIIKRSKENTPVQSDLESRSVSSESLGEADDQEEEDIEEENLFSGIREKSPTSIISGNDFSKKELELQRRKSYKLKRFNSAVETVSRDEQAEDRSFSEDKKGVSHAVKSREPKRRFKKPVKATSFEDAMLRDIRDADVIEGGTVLKLGKEVKFVDEPTVVAEEEEILLEQEVQTPEEEKKMKTDEGLKVSFGQVESEPETHVVHEKEKQFDKNDFTEQVTSEQNIFGEPEDIEASHDEHHEEGPNEEESSAVTTPVDENQDIVEELQQIKEDMVPYKVTEYCDQRDKGDDHQQIITKIMETQDASQVHSKAVEAKSTEETTTKLDSKQSEEKDDIPALKEVKELVDISEMHSKSTEVKPSDETTTKFESKQLKDKWAPEEEEEQEQEEEIEEWEEEEIILDNSDVPSKAVELNRSNEISTPLDTQQDEERGQRKQVVEEEEEEVVVVEEEEQAMTADNSKDHSKVMEVNRSNEIFTQFDTKQDEERGQRKQAVAEEEEEEVEIEEEDEQALVVDNSKDHSKAMEVNRSNEISTKLDARQDEETVGTKQVAAEEEGEVEEEEEELEEEEEEVALVESKVHPTAMEHKPNDEICLKSDSKQDDKKGDAKRGDAEKEEREELIDNSEVHSKSMESKSSDEISIETPSKQDGKRADTKEADAEEKQEEHVVMVDNSEGHSKAKEIKSSDEISTKTKQDEEKAVVDTSKVHSKPAETKSSVESTTKLLEKQGEKKGLTREKKTSVTKQSDEQDEVSTTEEKAATMKESDEAQHQRRSTGVRFAEPERTTRVMEGDQEEEEDSSSYTYSDSTQQKTPPKEAFWLIFSGEYTKAMSKDWHSGHFCCWQCDESLTGQRYVLRDDHPYCIKCYESVFANTCEECSKIIGIDSKDLSYKDKHWHEACFLCNKCRVSLVDKQFGSKADKIYCGNCYDSQFASRCDGCGEIFRAGTKKMEYKTRQWHEKCFCCCVCKTPIGTKSFIPREQEIYCATCYEEKFATRCVKCNKIITSGGVTYKNEPWHRECFTCTHCNTSLAGQRFTSRDEKPYCADCFGELFAKRCTSCSRPITGIGGTRFISFEDRHWHNDCFICASCKTSLVGRGFITDGDDIICPECAKQKLM